MSEEELTTGWEEMKKRLTKITNLLNSIEKQYKVEYWGSGEGVDIIIEESDFEMNPEDLSENIEKRYQQVISINNNGYVKFEKQEGVEEVK